MNLLRMLLMSTLVMGLLLPPGVVGAQNVKGSTDTQGAIPAGAASHASQKKTGEVKTEGKTGEVKKSAPITPSQRKANPRSRRDYFGKAAAPRRQAITDDLIKFRPNPAKPNPATPVPELERDQRHPNAPSKGPPGSPPTAAPAAPPVSPIQK